MQNAFRGSWMVVVALILGLAGCANTGETSGTYMDDSWITTKVKADLLAAKDLRSTHISVTTTKGVVRLTGTVPTSQESNQAAAVARSVAGVKGVENQIRIE
jgi:hyperosmotically inducible protein